MTYHHSSRPPANGGLGSAVLFIFLVIAGGSFLASMLENDRSPARVYLAEDIARTAAVR